MVIDLKCLHTCLFTNITCLPGKNIIAHLDFWKPSFFQFSLLRIAHTSSAVLHLPMFEVIQDSNRFKAKNFKSYVGKVGNQMYHTSAMISQGTLNQISSPGAHRSQFFTSHSITKVIEDQQVVSLW